MRARLAGLLAVLMLLAGCAREIPSTYIPPEPTATPDSGIDVDLTALSSTMVFAEVYNMLDCPEDYLGKTIRAAGEFAVYDDPDGRLYAVVVQDALACCAQGLEFVPAGEPAWPEEFPDPGQTVTVEGTFAMYRQGNFEFCHLVDASMTLAAE